MSLAAGERQAGLLRPWLPRFPAPGSRQSGSAGLTRERLRATSTGMKPCAIPSLILVAAALTACTTAPRAINPSQEGTIIRYDEFFTSQAEALAAAQKICAGYGRNAVLQNRTGTTEIIASYSCER